MDPITFAIGAWFVSRLLSPSEKAPAPPATTTAADPLGDAGRADNLPPPQGQEGDGFTIACWPPTLPPGWAQHTEEEQTDAIAASDVTLVGNRPLGNGQGTKTINQIRLSPEVPTELAPQTQLQAAAAQVEVTAKPGVDVGADGASMNALVISEMQSAVETQAEGEGQAEEDLAATQMFFAPPPQKPKRPI